MARANEADEKKKGARVAEGPRSGGWGRAIIDTAGLFFRPLVPLTIVIVVYAGISFLLWRPLNGESGVYESSAQALLSEKSLLNAVAANRRPAWISMQDFRQLAFEGAAAGKNQSVFRAGLSRGLAAVYERNSWVERVREVRLRYPAH